MKFNLTKEEMHDHLKVKKAALISMRIAPFQPFVIAES